MFQTGLRVDNMRDWLCTVCRAEIELSGRRPQPRLQEPPQGETQTLLQMAGGEAAAILCQWNTAAGLCREEVGGFLP